MNREKSELDPKQVFDFIRLPVPPERRQGQTHPRPEADPYSKDPRITDRTDLSDQAADVPYRAVDSHRKTGPPRLTPYEAHTVALEKQLEGPRVTRKGETHIQVTPHSSEMVAGGKQCASRSTITPTKTCSAADLDRCIKRRVGRSLK